MAQISPNVIEHTTECYAAVEGEMGFNCGHIKGWKLYDLRNPDLYRTLNQDPSEILAAFTTREELEAWREGLYKAPEPDEAKLKTVGTGKEKLTISQIL